MAVYVGIEKQNTNVSSFIALLRMFYSSLKEGEKKQE